MSTGPSGQASLARTLRVTVVLGVAKLVAAVLTGSQAVMASALDSLSDGAISGLNLWLLRRAEEPPDDEHPFGHGKLEGFAALFQAVVLTGVVVAVAWRAVQSLLAGGGPPPLAGPALLVMLGSLCVTGYLTHTLTKAAEGTGSLVLRADAAHYRMDLFTGGAVIVGLGAVALTGVGWADAVASLAVAAWMGREVGDLFREAANELMDRSMSAEERAAVDLALGTADARVVSWHELRTRRSGHDRFVQAHLVFPGDISLAEAHEAAEQVELAIRRAVPHVQVVLHMDVVATAEDLERPGAGVGTPAEARLAASLLGGEGALDDERRNG